MSRSLPFSRSDIFTCLTEQHFQHWDQSRKNSNKQFFIKNFIFIALVYIPIISFTLKIFLKKDMVTIKTVALFLKIHEAKIKVALNKV